MLKRFVFFLMSLLAWGGAAYASGGVLLYGTVDVAGEHYSGINVGSPASPSSGSITQLGSGGESHSSIGMRGSERLGPTLRAFYRIETGFCAAGLNQRGVVPGGYCSGDGFMQHMAFVGLAGNFGSLSLGAMHSLMFMDLVRFMDPFHGFLGGSYLNFSPLLLVGNGTLDRGSPMNLADLQQVAQYRSPHFGPFNFALGYSVNDSRSAATPSRSQLGELVAHYRRGPFLTGVDIMRVANAQNFGPAFAAGEHVDLTQWFANFHTPAWILSGGLNQFTLSAHAGSIVSYLVGIQIPHGRNTLIASIARSRDDLWHPGGARSTLLAVGDTYALSRQTDLYASYARVANADRAAMGIGDGTSLFGGLPNQTAGGIIAGMQVRF